MKLEWLASMIETHNPHEIRLDPTLYDEVCKIIEPRRLTKDSVDPRIVNNLKFMGVTISCIPWWMMSGHKIEFVHVIDDLLPEAK
jgi:hypothetical protein